MITAIVRYRLPTTIDRNACRLHFLRIAPGFSDVPGLISKHFIWSPEGEAGGIYQWASKSAAEAFYSGPWRQGIVDRYGVEPVIEYFEVFSIADNANGLIRVPEVA